MPRRELLVIVVLIHGLTVGGLTHPKRVIGIIGDLPSIRLSDGLGIVHLDHHWQISDWSDCALLLGRYLLDADRRE